MTNVLHGQTAKDVYAALGGTWISARALHRSLDCWAEATVASVLREMAKIGKIDAREVPIPSGGTMWMYKRKG